MKGTYRVRILAMILPLLLLISISTIVLSEQVPVDLGTISGFAVLAGTTITNIGTTAINGNAGGAVGLYPGSDFTGQSTLTMTGTLHVNDAPAIQAKSDLAEAFVDVDSRIPAILIPSELGGTTVVPGVYYSTDGMFHINGTLTLDAQGNSNSVFIFLTASTLIAENNSNVNLMNGANYANIFWKVGTSVTLGVNSHLVGRVFALISITANTGATVQGQLFARNGAVTLQANTITNGSDATLTPTLTRPAATPTSVANPQTTDPGSVAVLAIAMLAGITGSAVILFRRDK